MSTSVDNELPRAKSPFSPPGCRWIPMDAGSPVPGDATYLNGNLNGNKVYIGRVSAESCLFVGTAIPDKGVCMYLNKKLEVKSSANYEILTASGVWEDPLWFVQIDLDAETSAYSLNFVSGVDENDTGLCAGRYIDEKYNTYYGWVDGTNRYLHIPRDSDLGPQVLDKDFGILVHRFLHRMCTGCPMPPQEAVFK